MWMKQTSEASLLTPPLTSCSRNLKATIKTSANTVSLKNADIDAFTVGKKNGPDTGEMAIKVKSLFSPVLLNNVTHFVWCSQIPLIQNVIALSHYQHRQEIWNTPHWTVSPSARPPPHCWPRPDGFHLCLVNLPSLCAFLLLPAWCVTMFLLVSSSPIERFDAGCCLLPEPRRVCLFFWLSLGFDPFLPYKQWIYPLLPPVSAAESSTFLFVSWPQPNTYPDVANNPEVKLNIDVGV